MGKSRRRGGRYRYVGVGSAVALIELRCHPPTSLADSATLFHSTESRLPFKTLNSVSFSCRQKRISNRWRPNYPFTLGPTPVPQSNPPASYVTTLHCSSDYVV